MLFWLFNALFSIKVGLCSCRPEVQRLGIPRLRSQYRIERLSSAAAPGKDANRLPRLINESSGLARRSRDGRTIWTHNDGGGRPTLYGIDWASGALIDSLSLPTLRNVDWEDLAQADTARLFIADLGNNANTRQDLVIYDVQAGGAQATTSAIRLSYADQPAFPPQQHRNFDCEALFYRRDSLFLLTKNRAGHRVKLYGVPARGGMYRPAPIDSVYIKSMVTGSALSPDAQTLAVLTYGKIIFFRLSTRPGAGTRLTSPTGCLRLPRGQTEGITFLNDTDLLISNERGRLYRLRHR